MRFRPLARVGRWLRGEEVMKGAYPPGHDFVFNIAKGRIAEYADRVSREGTITIDMMDPTWAQRVRRFSRPDWGFDAIDWDWPSNYDAFTHVGMIGDMKVWVRN